LGAVALALGLGFLVATDTIFADEKDDVAKLAEAMAKGNAPAKKAIDDLVKADLEDVMKSFKLRKDKGIGVGEKPGVITPDGIEAKFVNIGKKQMSPKEINDQGEALIKAAHATTVIGKVALAKAPGKKVGAKDPKDWKQWSEDMIKSSDDLAKALKAKNPKGVLDAVKNVNASCNNCHGVFRD
jgi:cytochrome c556